MKTLIYLADSKKLVEKDVDDISLDFLQSQVGGYIEITYIDYLEENGIDVFCNEEGKLLGLLHSAYLLDNNDTIYDVIAGNMVFCSHDEDGESIGLTDEQIKVIEDIFTRYIYASYGYLPYIKYNGKYN